jgi:hypothetical protein
MQLDGEIRHMAQAIALCVLAALTPAHVDGSRDA